MNPKLQVAIVEAILILLDKEIKLQKNLDPKFKFSSKSRLEKLLELRNKLGELG